MYTGDSLRGQNKHRRKEASMTEKRTRAQLEVRVAELEGIVESMAQFSKQVALAEKRGVKVLDIGLRIDQLRPLVECAEEIRGREE